jgi:dnd system-associated protein 4
MTKIDTSDINWRTIGVKRERTHEGLINRLSIKSRGVFTLLKDLMVFAAMVGYSNERKRELTGDTVEIILDTYSSDQKDGFIYLIAMLETKGGACLKDEQLSQSVVYFEEYCNGGLYQITEWLDDNPGDPDGVDTILNQIYKKLGKSKQSSEIDNETLELEI